jgi:hypothetical protein
MTDKLAASEGVREAVRANLAQARLEGYRQRRAEWALRMRGMLAEEEALDVLEGSLIDALAPGSATPARGEIPGASPCSFNEILEAYERRLIQQALDACHGVQRDAALVLGLCPSTLNAKLKRLGLRTGRSHGMPSSGTAERLLAARGRGRGLEGIDAERETRLAEAELVSVGERHGLL